MTQITAQLSNYRQSPRKVRLIANFVKGKNVSVAVARLSLLPKRASDPVQKLVMSAIANAKNAGLSEESLVVKSFTVDEGAIMYRRRARARGSAAPIRKRTSHLKVVLESKEEKTKAKIEKPKDSAKPTTKKAEPKAKTTKKVVKKADTKSTSKTSKTKK